MIDRTSRHWIKRSIEKATNAAHLAHGILGDGSRADEHLKAAIHHLQEAENEFKWRHAIFDLWAPIPEFRAGLSGSSAAADRRPHSSNEPMGAGMAPRL